MAGCVPPCDPYIRNQALMCLLEVTQADVIAHRRLWLQKLASPQEKERGESALLRVLEVWKDKQIFPPLFTKGLLCLAQAPILDVSAKEANAEPDEQLKQKLVRWFSGLNQGSLPYECQMRGLAGRTPAINPSTCRARLCAFERFWHLHVGAARASALVL
eukprot:s3136_g7.t1